MAPSMALPSPSLPLLSRVHRPLMSRPLIAEPSEESHRLSPPPSVKRARARASSAAAQTRTRASYQDRSCTAIVYRGPVRGPPPQGPPEKDWPGWPTS